MVCGILIYGICTIIISNRVICSGIWSASRCNYFLCSVILIGMTQAMVYPTLTSYLSFVLPKVGRNMLLGLFIACADLGISLGGALMGPISDLVGFKWMYLICGMLVIVIMIMS
ncbi:MFS transporter, partial [Staphylococcus aureus]